MQDPLGHRLGRNQLLASERHEPDGDILVVRRRRNGITILTGRDQIRTWANHDSLALLVGESLSKPVRQRNDTWANCFVRFGPNDDSPGLRLDGKKAAIFRAHLSQVLGMDLKRSLVLRQNLIRLAQE